MIFSQYLTYSYKKEDILIKILMKTRKPSQHLMSMQRFKLNS